MFRRAQLVLWLAALVCAVLAASSAGKTPPTSLQRPDATSPLLTKAIAAQKSHAQVWRIAPGIVGSGVGLTPTGQPVVEVFTTRPGVRVPETLGGVRVRPVVTGMIVARSATLRYPRPVPIGVSSGLADFATGTLGARVTNGSSVFALSNNHVFAGVNQASIGDAILQPGPIEDGGTDPADRIGTLADYQEIDFSGSANTMDAAIALTTTADVGTATLPDGYGSPNSTTTTAAVGMSVQKYGRTTGFTTGSINAVNVDVDVCYFPLTETICFPGFEAHFVNQFSVTPGPFSASGDSGSLLVTQGSNQPVGLLFAGGEGLTIANPIDAVLQRFNVAIDGAPAEDGPPGAPTGLNAVAGDGQVALSWTAPSFDGGSAISNYIVYRGTAPNPTGVLTTIPAQTSFTDTNAQNGTTYYYKVSAVNSGSGEGPTSNEASATPIAAVAPATLAAPLDSFNRPNETLSDAGRWTNSIIGGESGFNVNTNQLACSVATTCTAWRNNQQFGPDAEVWARLSTLAGVNNQVRLYARLQMPGASTGYLLRTNELSGTDEVWLDRFNGGATRLLTISQELAAGDTMLLRAKGTTIEAWRLPSGGSWSRLGVVQDSTYPNAAYVGVGLRGTTGRLDDFGARSTGATTQPGAPSGLAAVAGDGQVAISWTAPSVDGGSAITGYTVYRGTSPNPTSALTTLPVQTTFTDTNAQNATTYYYKVSAVNANGEGPKSNEASATPIAAVAPATLAAPLDSFNRPNETLSDAGRWTNSIIPGENGFNVNSNQLACSVTTTCTAWRNNVQLGPDVEVWTRMTTLPGVNNQLRLYARLHMPGASTGYLLRTQQLSGTDEVWLDRFNGGATRLLTISQELAAGDTMLLRAKGTTIEAWRLPSGGSWSRLGVVQDSTYPNAAYVGVGLRGTTGRLDDFGARTLGGAPPDTTAPTDPTNLAAGAVGSSQINLSWSASFDAVGVTLYRIERCQGASCANFSEIATVPGNQTTFQNTSLAASTAYSYRVRAEDAALNQSGYSNLASATTLAPPDTTAPTDPTNLAAGAVGSSQINLSWSASFDAVGVTLYRIERCQGASCANFSEIATVPGNQTTFQNTSLAASTAYSYRVRAEDAALNQSGYSNLASATTLAPPDTTAPTDPTNLAAGAVGSSQINLSWSASFDAVGVTLYRIERCQGASCANFSEIATVPGNQTTFQNTSLAASTAYSYRVRAEDAALNQSGYSNLASATTLAPPDTTAPTDPTNLAAGAVGSSQINLSWSASFDAVGVTLYRIERCQGASCANFSEIATVPGNQTTFQNTSLAASTAYSYRVRAEDAALNQSGYSNLASATTLAPPDTTAPTDPTNLAAGAVGSSQINLSWSASFDAVGVTLYRIERCQGASCANFSEIATVPGNQTTFQNTSLAASTAYSYRVRAEDAALNQSGYSNLASATTLAPPDTTAPTDPTNLAAGAVGSSQINLSWSASFDAVGVTLYRIERCQGASCANFSEIATVPGNQTTFQNTSLARLHCLLVPRARRGRRLEPERLLEPRLGDDAGPA